MKNARIFTEKINWQLVLLAVATGAFYIYLAAQIPYTHDDWDWGLSNGWEQLLTANINSRYSGNFLEVLMTRSGVFKTLFMGLSFCALPLILAVFAAKEKTQIVPIAIAANILLLMMPQAIWQQTYGWVAGFANFVTSALWVGIFFCLSKGLFEKDAQAPQGALKVAAVMIFCVSMQLFAENITVFMLGVSVVFWIGAVVKWRKVSAYYTAMLLGCAIGAGIMFSSSMYDTLLSTGQAVEGYRELTFDRNTGLSVIVRGFLVRFFTGFFPGVYGYYDGVYCVIIGVLTVLLIIKSEKMLIPKFFSGAFVGFSTAVLAAVYYLPTFGAQMSLSATVAVNVLFFASIFAAIILAFWQDKLKLFKMSGIWLAAPLVMVPLVVINTVGERSFLMPLVFLVMFICALLAELNIRKSMVLSVILLVPLFYWGYIYTDIGATGRERMQIIAEAIDTNAVEITLPKFPHEEYLWEPDPKSEHRKKYFRLFYGLNEDVEINLGEGGM